VFAGEDNDEMKGNHGDTEGGETRGRGDGVYRIVQRKNRGNVKSVSSPYFLCALCASVVKILQCRII